jgi:Sulfotransferase family
MASEITAPAVKDETFRVPTWIHVFGGFISRHREFWIRLGNLESKYLADRLAAIPIDRPIYIAGLARAGTTILLEVVASHRGIATHQYHDFPPIFTPFAWNWWLRHVPLKENAPVERTHADGIFVTPESPEAMEEVLWMTFFPEAHDPRCSSVLDSTVINGKFEAFYRDHIRKLILTRGGRRYASKENYNITRLEYLRKLFPDARFVIPIRHPVSHIASLIKEHRLFSEGHRRQPRSIEHFRRVGHFEFGADLRPINTGDSSRVEEIRALWRGGEEVRGWARYWAMIHSFVADRLEAEAGLRAASMVVRLEDLCAEPERVLRKLCAHCGLEDADSIVARHASKLHAPTYYKAKFSDVDLEIIEQETAATAARFGYTGGFAESTTPPLRV